MYVNIWWQNPYHASEDTNSISTSEDQSPPKSARTLNKSQLELNTYKIHTRKKCRDVLTKLIPCQHGINSTCIEQSPPMSAWTQNSSSCATQNLSHLVFSKPLELNIYLNKCWPNPSQAREDSTCISTFVDQTHSIQSRTENAIQPVFSKPPTPCQRGNQMHISKFWPYSTYASEEINSVDESHQEPVRKENLSQLALTIPIPCQRGQKMYHYTCWPKPLPCRRWQKCIST